MQTVELKLKQASAVLGVPPKELQNFVQFRIVTPKRRKGLYWFDENTLLKAKCAWYLKQSLGASSECLVRFVDALSRVPDLTTRRETVRLQARPAKGKPAVEVVVPVPSLARELEERLPLAVVARDLPRGRKRRGWKAEFLRAVRDAASDLESLSERDILETVQQARRERGRRPEIAVVTQRTARTA